MKEKVPAFVHLSAGKKGDIQKQTAQGKVGETSHWLVGAALSLEVISTLKSHCR